MRPRGSRPAGRRPLVSTLLAALVVIALVPAPSQGDAAWTRLGSGSTRGISGLAVSPSGWVIARDNKSAGQSRIALLSPALQVTELSWPGTAPQDLESVAAVPGTANRYVACTSARACSVFDIAGSTITVRRTFTLPVGGSQNESLTFTTAPGGATVAVWADRGSPTAPGKLHAATVDLGAWTFGKAVTLKVTVPWPTGAVRHVTDAAVVAGHVIVASATDPGANGPFNSAVYDVATLGQSGTRITLTGHSPTELGRFPGHKIEGLSCAAGADLLGTDDEKAGGSVASLEIC